MELNTMLNKDTENARWQQELQHPDHREREHLAEEVLALVLRYVPFDVDEGLRQALLKDDTGSWVLSDGLVSPTILHGITWIRPSLYWMWTSESPSNARQHSASATTSCHTQFCLNFAAKEGHFHGNNAAGEATSEDDQNSGGFLKEVQWTLELSSGELDQIGGFGEDVTSAREVRRFDLPVVTSLHLEGDIVHAVGSAKKPIECFWKIGEMELLSIKVQQVTMAGTIEFHHNVSTTNETRIRAEGPTPQLRQGAVFSCSKIALAKDLPSTSEEHIQLAQLMSLLDPWKTPGLQWRAPPVPHFDGMKYQSLADIFRRVFSFLEDMDNRKINLKKTRGDPLEADAWKDQPSQPEQQNSRRKIDWKGSLTDSLAITGGLVATGASFVTPIGAAVAVAAVGVKDGVASAAQKGQASRKGEKYKVGDVTRGIVTSFKERKSRRELQQVNEEEVNASDRNAGRYVGVVGSSLGAAVGRTLVGGTVGSLAGSLVGSVATQEVVDKQRQETKSQYRQPQGSYPSVDDDIMRQLEHGNSPNHPSPSNEELLNKMDEKPWQFGDRFRNVVQRGKEADGRNENSGYRLGDFSRGLFSKR